MFLLASFARSKVGEYGTYFDKNYANPVLSGLRHCVCKCM